VNKDLHGWLEDARLLALRVVPVIDLLAGRAVHARGGHRSAYKPVESTLCSGHDPLRLAQAYRDLLGLSDLYLADLDAIAAHAPDLKIVRRLAGAGFNVWLDAGVQDAESIHGIESAGASTVIAATETLRGPAALADLVRRARAGSVVFGLDLHAGRPSLAPGSNWKTTEPAGLIVEALSAGIRRILVLDTAMVGSGRGIGTLGLVEKLRRDHPGIEVSVGGGVGSRLDLDRLEDLGVSAVLVASAIHDGRIGARELTDFR
jgi:phosphoribosylformimino-5-aminoimidazole carboxamide ribotide isomerase